MKELMIEFAIAGVSSFILTAILSRCIIPILKAKKAGQPIREEGPKSHFDKAGTPTMGGIAFILAIAIVLTGMAIWYAFRAKQNDLVPLALTMALAVMNGMIGFYDDYKKLAKKQNEGLKTGQKFALQTLVAIIYVAVLAFSGNLKTAINIPFFASAVELGWVYYVFAVILIVGVVNSVNLTDGLDGLASSVTLVVAIFFSVVAFMLKASYLDLNLINTVSASSSSLALVCAVTVGAMVGFLVFNHHPAQVFMGDTGSLFLGGIVTGAAFIINEPMIIIIAGGVYILEVVSDIIQVSYFKLTKGKRIFKCAPIHHHFEACNWSEVKIVTVFSIATVLFCVIAWFGLSVNII